MVLDFSARPGRDFAPERNQPEINVFQAAADHIKALAAQGKSVVVAAWSEGSRERLGHVLAEHGLPAPPLVTGLPGALALGKGAVSLAVLGIEHGFETESLAVIGEQDILGDRLVRRRKKHKRTENLLGEIAALSAGDLVVHVDHGIGRFIGLELITAAGAPHDCLEIHYAGGDKLYLPVENIELLTRYGSEDTEVALDRLGGAGWQGRKARMKNRIREMAKGLIAIAAQRMLKQAPKLVAPEGLYDEFCARFPYDETEDQAGAIDAVLDDLGLRAPDGSSRVRRRRLWQDRGRAARRLLRRRSTAVRSPSSRRRRCWRASITRISRSASRACPSESDGCRAWSAPSRRARPREQLGEGSVDILIGTHAILGKGVVFKDLSLVVIDEEQHFGVGHKERLKELRAEVHVLTLSAMPIPRTLQLALTGVRELSLIATPPVDRLAVRSFVSPFDP